MLYWWCSKFVNPEKDCWKRGKLLKLQYPHNVGGSCQKESSWKRFHSNIPEADAEKPVKDGAEEEDPRTILEDKT